MEKLAENYPYTSTEVLACRFLNKSAIDISSRTVPPQLYSRGEERFSYKTPNKSCSEVNLERIIDMQMDISKECTKQSIKTCVVHKIFTSQMNVLFLSVSYHGKSDAKKVHSFMEEFPTVRKSLLFIQR